MINLNKDNLPDGGAGGTLGSLKVSVVIQESPVPFVVQFEGARVEGAKGCRLYCEEQEQPSLDLLVPKSPGAFDTVQQTASSLCLLKSL